MLHVGGRENSLKSGDSISTHLDAHSGLEVYNLRNVNSFSSLSIDIAIRIFLSVSMNFKISIIGVIVTAWASVLAGASSPRVAADSLPHPRYGQQARNHQGSYTFTQMTTVQYATPLPSSPPVTTYMPSASMKAIMPPGVHTTTWTKNVDASDWENPYGQAEWNRRWATFLPNVSISTASISTTVEPTPIPSASLILPPDSGFSYNNENAKNLNFPKGFILRRCFISQSN